ncbi:hypothetical protein KIH23_07325 [Flavobacterium sp. CYK-55]|uniref:hypothetical protein n=1 Tax=Flavobacterium sp. CYK-55 TaxID=2835529 RepID=UPI001BCB7B27|nr:hypothetical protein [Flavobacterium sp. CYK-55]MBS7787105.1 hypothetical protein [Flavobacterium sp. CYK-55]
MKKLLYLICFSSLFGCTTDRDIAIAEQKLDPASELIYFWNFNSISGTVTEVLPDYQATKALAKISYPGSGAGYMDVFSPGYDVNLRKSEEAGSGLRARNPSNTRSLILELPTTGFKKVVLSYATAKTSSGAASQIFSYTVNGSDYITDGLTVRSFNPVDDPSSSLLQLDFSSIPAVNNNANFKVKINFEGPTASGASGNNRFDNVAVDAVPF